MEPKLVATQKEVEEMIVTLEADKKTAAETKVRVTACAAAVAPRCVPAGYVLSQAKCDRDLSFSQGSFHKLHKSAGYPYVQDMVWRGKGWEGGGGGDYLAWLTS